MNKYGNWNSENWKLNLEIEILKKYLLGMHMAIGTF